MLKWRLFAVIIILSVTVSSCKIGRFVIYNFADIKDYKKFPSRSLTSGESKFHFYTTEYGKYPDSLKLGDERVAFDDLLENNKTVAFLIIKNDTIHYEKYFKGYNQESIIPSFSMAKSITSILIGCAIDDGLIKSVDEPITNYIPELKENGGCCDDLASRRLQDYRILRPDSIHSVPDIRSTVVTEDSRD